MALPDTGTAIEAILAVAHDYAASPVALRFGLIGDAGVQRFAITCD